MNPKPNHSATATKRTAPASTFARGVLPNGDRKRVYLTQPDGKKQGVKRRFFFSDDVPKPGPGAAIFVPARKSSEGGTNTAAVLGVLASVFASLTTVIVVLRR